MLEFATDDPLAERAVSALYHAAPATPAAPTLRYQLLRAAGSTSYVARAPARPPLGPTTLAEAWAFLEWRATEDLLGAGGEAVFLHAGAAQVGTHLVLLVGYSGAGKSTLVAHLLTRGHPILGDDVVRFTPQTGLFSSVGRSLKLDDKSLSELPLVAERCRTGGVGTFLASSNQYVSPAAIRREWEAPDGRPRAVVLLERGRHKGPARLTRSSDGAAAVRVSQSLIGVRADGATETGRRLVVQLLESLGEVTAYRARGGDPSGLARAIERELAP